MEPLERRCEDGTTELVVPPRALAGLALLLVLWVAVALGLLVVRDDLPAYISPAAAVTVASLALVVAVWPAVMVVRGLLARLVVARLSPDGVAPLGRGIIPWEAIRGIETREVGAGTRSVFLRVRSEDVPAGARAEMARGPRRSLERDGLVRLRGAGDPGPVADRLRRAVRQAREDEPS